MHHLVYGPDPCGPVSSGSASAPLHHKALTPSSMSLLFMARLLGAFPELAAEVLGSAVDIEALAIGCHVMESKVSETLLQTATASPTN